VDDRGSGVPFPAEAGNFSVLHRVQTGSEAQPPSYPVGTGPSFPRVKRPERESDYPPLPRAEVKNAWSSISIPNTFFMAWCLVKKSEGQICLYLTILSYKLFTENLSGK